MTYALVLLAMLAVFGWGVWGGLAVPGLDTAYIQEHAGTLYGKARDNIRAAVKEAVRKQIHKAVDDSFTE